MARYFRYAALAVLLPLAAQAQTAFEPGYVVPASGDTLRGELDYRDAYFSATQCRFRPSPAAEPRTYRPGELLAYGLPTIGKHYRTLTVVAGSPPSFAEVLVSGPATLYYLRDATRADHYFLEAPQLALTELVHRKVLLPNQNIIQEQNIYRTTLTQAMPDCPGAEALLPTLAFTAAALRRVVNVFNECQGVVPAPAPAPRQLRQRPLLGVLVGGQLTHPQVRFPTNYNQLITLAPGNAKSLAVGLNLGVPLPALSRKLSLEVALYYARQQYEQATSSPAAIAGVGPYYQFEFAYLRLPLLLRYTVPKGAVRPVLEAGPTLAYATTLDARVTITDGFNHVTTTPFFEQNQRRFQEGICGGIGVQAAYWQGRRAVLLARYEADTGWTEGQGLQTGASRYSALLTLDLTK